MDVQSPEGALLSHGVQFLHQKDVAAAPLVRHGLVVNEILAEATSGRYDLVVIGAHPTGGWQRFLLEDVTAQIVLKVDRPILVIPV
ncbi:MAG: universal stress protein [Chloroflexi bacterium]|nr:universal stress protein [Chloroflexota bacterium]